MNTMQDAQDAVAQVAQMVEAINQKVDLAIAKINNGSDTAPIVEALQQVNAAAQAIVDKITPVVG